MKLRQITWKNYRRIPDDQINVRHHLVLVGPNDSGKSSVLRIVDLCLGVSGARLAALVTERDFTDPSASLVLQVVLDGVEDADRAAFPDEISTTDGETLTVAIEAVIEGEDAEQKQVRRWFPDAGHGRSPTRVQLYQFGWAYVPPTRSLFRELGSGSTGAIRTLLSSVDLTDDQTTFEEAADVFQSALLGSTALTTFREELAGALSGALPRAISPDDLKLATESELLDDPLASVTVTVSDGDYSAPISEQSDGIRALSVLSLLGLSHRTASIVGIDEPELHLHYTAQRVIAAKLRERSGQRVLVTHSPAIVREMDPLDIVTMREDRRPRQLQTGADIAELEAFTRHWSHNLIEPLTARKVMLVEGPSDRILCERVGQLADVDLNRKGIAIFELGGSSLFARAYRLFGPDGFDLPVFGLLDMDARDEWTSVLGCRPDEISESGRFEVCDPDLEATYVDLLGVERTLELLLASPSISETAVRKACGIDLADMTVSVLADYCGHKKRKVRAALAVAAGLSKSEAAALGAVTRIVRAVGT